MYLRSDDGAFADGLYNGFLLLIKTLSGKSSENAG